jgi:hypothetical protein
LAILKTTSPGQLGKYVVPLVEALNGSMSKKTPIKAGTKTFIIKKSKSNEKTIKQFSVLAGSSRTQNKALDLVLETTDTKSPFVSIKQLDKPKVNLNFGDMAEGVVAAAIATRFVNKNKDITTQDVGDLLDELASMSIKNYPGKSGKFVEKNFKSPNKNKNTVDTVRLYISLADVNMSNLLDPKNRKSLEPYINSAIIYANSNHVSTWAISLYENNRFDTIEVISDGLGGQGKTKVDVFVKVTNDKNKLVPVDINLSMKAGDVKQFGQVSGAEFEKQMELWERLFGYGDSIKSLKPAYDKLMFKAKKPDEAVTLVYKKIETLLKIDLSGKKSSVRLKKLSEAINYFATLGEENVSLLQLGSGSATIYNFQDIYSKILGKKFTARIETGKSDLPSLIIFSGDKDLIKFRVKQEFKPDGSPYIRNYIEKEKMLTDLLAVNL